MQKSITQILLEKYQSDTTETSRKIELKDFLGFAEKVSNKW